MTSPQPGPSTAPVGDEKRGPTPRLRGAAVVVTVLVGVVGLLSAGTASAASYRYWSFWSGGSNGSWAYQQQGPNTNVPADGTVDGWRFGVSADSANAAEPRRKADFASVCGTTAPVHGKKRVAVVIDYGTAADSGSGATPPAAKAACAVLDENASSAQALAQLAPPLRYDVNGILCAISGYPQSGCGEVVSGGKNASGSGGRAGSHSGLGANVGGAAGAALVVALAAGAWYQRRRRERGRRGN